MRLDRDGPTLDLEIEIFAQLQQAEIVRLRFTHVEKLEIGGFNQQNGLFDLLPEPDADGPLQVTLQSGYGLGGSFRCSGVTQLM